MRGLKIRIEMDLGTSIRTFITRTAEHKMILELLRTVQPLCERRS